MAAKREQLSRERITNTALDVVARDGLEGLSMRRLAQELDVWPMSMYRHFRDKEDLLDAVAAAGAEAAAPPPQRGSVSDRLRALAAEVRAVLARQPSGLRRRTLASPGVERMSEAARAVLREGGASADAAAGAWGAVLAYVIGSIELEADGADFEAGLDLVLRGTISA